MILVVVVIEDLVGNTCSHTIQMIDHVIYLCVCVCVLTTNMNIINQLNL